MQDFQANFTRIEICMLTPDSVLEPDEKKSWKIRREKCRWQADASAGGCRNFIETFHINPQIRYDIYYSLLYRGAEVHSFKNEWQEKEPGGKGDNHIKPGQNKGNLFLLFMIKVTEMIVGNFERNFKASSESRRSSNSFFTPKRY